MGLFSRGASHSNRLCRYGSLRKFPHHLPSLDIIHSSSAIPFFPGTGLCSGLRLWLVIGFTKAADGRHLLVTNLNAPNIICPF